MPVHTNTQHPIYMLYKYCEHSDFDFITIIIITAQSRTDTIPIASFIRCPQGLDYTYTFTHSLTHIHCRVSQSYVVGLGTAGWHGVASTLVTTVFRDPCQFVTRSQHEHLLKTERKTAEFPEDAQRHGVALCAAVPHFQSLRCLNSRSRFQWKDYAKARHEDEQYL